MILAGIQLWDFKYIYFLWRITDIMHYCVVYAFRGLNIMLLPRTSHMY